MNGRRFEDMDSIPALRSAWAAVFGSHEPPDEAQFSVWLLKHDVSIIRSAFGTTAMKFKQQRGQMTREHLIRFASAVMNRLHYGAKQVQSSSSSSTNSHGGKCLDGRRTK